MAVGVSREGGGLWMLIDFISYDVYDIGDPAINDALRIVAGCLRPIPAENVLQSAELRHKGATLSLAHHAMEPAGHLLH